MVTRTNATLCAGQIFSHDKHLSLPPPKTKCHMFRIQHTGIESSIFHETIWIECFGRRVHFLIIEACPDETDNQLQEIVQTDQALPRTTDPAGIQ